MIAKCDLQRQIALPLVTDDGTWGRIVAICGDLAGRWSRLRRAGRVGAPLQRDRDRLGDRRADRVLARPAVHRRERAPEPVPEAVVRELREECY